MSARLTNKTREREEIRVFNFLVFTTGIYIYRERV